VRLWWFSFHFPFSRGEKIVSPDESPIPRNTSPFSEDSKTFSTEFKYANEIKSEISRWRFSVTAFFR
jgi:hypothetical protein